VDLLPVSTHMIMQGIL